MKYFFLLLLSLQALAEPLSQKYEKNKYYFTALNEFFIETYDKKKTLEDLERLERLLYFTGIELLEDYETKLLEQYSTSSTSFILGRRFSQLKDQKKALSYFEKVHENHRYFPETQLSRSKIFNEQNDALKESLALNQCKASAIKQEDQAESIKIKRYYRMIFEICQVSIARELYKKGKFEESIIAYDKITKDSYKWPYIILEKAWAYYQLGDYNRTLGLLLTYKSPLLETYFFPEAEYLAALSYFKLCLFEDSLVFTKQYDQFYRPRFTELYRVLDKNRSSQSYFYNLMFNSTDDFKKNDKFAKQIITRLKKQIRYSLDFNSVFKIEQEMRRIHEDPERTDKLRHLKHLNSVKENMVSKINYNTKTDIFNFLETVPFFSSELFKVNLEVLSRKRDLVYQKQDLTSKRSRGDYSNVQRSRFEHFWTFEGAFWADELGDYSLGLKSNCDLKEKEIHEEEK